MINPINSDIVQKGAFRASLDLKVDEETRLQGPPEEAEIQISAPVFVHSQGETGVDLMTPASFACCLELETHEERPRHQVCGAVLSHACSGSRLSPPITMERESILLFLMMKLKCPKLYEKLLY